MSGSIRSPAHAENTEYTSSKDTLQPDSIRPQHVVDEEKQRPQSQNDFLVNWDGESDPLNPRNFSIVRRWYILIIICLGSVLVTMSSSIYASTYAKLIANFHSSQEVITLGLSFFVLGLAVGPMVVSPMSEFYGRRPIYLLSMSFFLIWTIPCAVAQNTQTMLIARFLAGISGSAFMSVAGGSVSDLFLPKDLQSPMMAFTIAPFAGPVLGPLIGGFINQYTSWRWTFYILLIYTAVLLILLVFTVPETHHPTLLTVKAKRLRLSDSNQKYHSPAELLHKQTSLRTALWNSLRTPFQLLFLEPMCGLLCVYSALVLGILYLFFGAFFLVFSTNHKFTLSQTGLTFLGLLVGGWIGVFCTPLINKNYQRLIKNARIQKEEMGEEQAKKPDPEFRLPPAILGGVLMPIGLFWFGWTTYSSVHWIVPIIGTVFFALGMLLSFSGVWTFLVDAYPTYAASALAANTCARCVFAAAFPLFGNQMYKRLGFQWASSLLGFLLLAMMPFPYLFFRYGKVLRARSRFASLSA